MNTRIAVLISFLATATAGPVLAQSAYLWEELTSGNGMTISYNPLTVRHSNGMVTLLEKTSYDTPQPLGNGISQGYYTVDLTIDCAANTYSHANYTAYTADGAVISDATSPFPAGMMAIPTESPPEGFKMKFCT